MTPPNFGFCLKLKAITLQTSKWMRRVLSSRTSHSHSQSSANNLRALWNCTLVMTMHSDVWRSTRHIWLWAWTELRLCKNSLKTFIRNLRLGSSHKKLHVCFWCQFYYNYYLTYLIELRQETSQYSLVKVPRVPEPKVSGQIEVTSFNFDLQIESKNEK